MVSEICCLRETLAELGKRSSMENYIICGQCNKKIVNNPLVDLAIKSEGNGSLSISCDCGEKITYWDITAQLREQKTIISKLKSWWQSIALKQG